MPRRTYLEKKYRRRGLVRIVLPLPREHPTAFKASSATQFLGGVKGQFVARQTNKLLAGCMSFVHGV